VKCIFVGTKFAEQWNSLYSNREQKSELIGYSNQFAFSELYSAIFMRADLATKIERNVNAQMLITV
jgi:hypothetical protein